MEVVEEGFARFARQWDRFDAPSADGVLISVEAGEQALALALAGRLEKVFDGVVLGGDVPHPFPHRPVSASLPASVSWWPHRPETLAEGIGAADARTGHSVVVWCGPAGADHTLVLGSTLTLDGRALRPPRAFSQLLERVVVHGYDVTALDEVPWRLASSRNFLDELVGSMEALAGRPARYPLVRPITPVTDPSDSEAALLAAVRARAQETADYAWDYPYYLFHEDAEEASALLLGLVREKLEPSQVEALTVLVTDQEASTDLLGLARLTQAL